MINLRKLSFINDGLGGISLSLLGIAFLIGNDLVQTVLLWAWIAMVAVTYIYKKNRKPDIEDDLAFENKMQAEAEAGKLTLIALLLIGGYCIITDTNIILKPGYILLFCGIRMLIGSLLFILHDRTAE